MRPLIQCSDPTPPFAKVAEITEELIDSVPEKRCFPESSDIEIGNRENRSAISAPFLS